MSDYMPSTGEVRRRYAYARSDKPGHKNQSAIAEFDRWLAAHDAEVLAAAGVAPQPEPEYEYSCVHPVAGVTPVRFINPEEHAKCPGAAERRMVSAWEPAPTQEGEQP